jgi:hypothetical protein
MHKYCINCEVLIEEGITMTEFNRRAFVGMSVGGFSAFCIPQPVFAAAQCVTGVLPGFVPAMLTVDCASKSNFRTFRRNSKSLGLAGVVSMTFVRGSQGGYPAGNLFLFPWIKPSGAGRNFTAVMPVNQAQSTSADPIPDGTIPVDEYFCRFVLKAPWTSFIGFQLDEPYGAEDAKRDWFTNVDKLADGAGVGIDWTSSNLNNPWFGGSNWIPKSDTCGGQAWRKVIIAGLQQASVAAC